MGTMAVTIKRALMLEMRTNDHRDDHLEYLATMPRIFYTKQSNRFGSPQDERPPRSIEGRHLTA